MKITKKLNQCSDIFLYLLISLQECNVTEILIFLNN